MKICIQPAFAAYLAVVAVCASLAESIGAVIALVVHEAGHVMASSWFGMRIKRIEFTPFGGVIEYGMGRGPDKGLSGALTAMAGPLCNYLTLLLLGCVGALFSDSAVLRAAAKSSLMMMCMNLLPVLPLDGGRVVFSIGYYLWPVLPLIRLLTGFGTVLGGFCIAAAVYGAWRYANFNLSLPAEQKIDFLLGQFKHKLLGYCKQQMAIINNCKNTIADIHVDFLYKVYTQKQTGLSDFICIEPSLFNKNSILKIMSANGLLNFDF